MKTFLVAVWFLIFAGAIAGAIEMSLSPSYSLEHILLMLLFGLVGIGGIAIILSPSQKKKTGQPANESGGDNDQA